MPRYVIQRTFTGGLSIPQTDQGVQMCRAVVEVNAADGVTWLHSYVTADRTRTFCVYDGPSPEAIRRVAARNQLPVDAISEVSVLDPYFYRA
jgi:hypothetical protein